MSPRELLIEAGARLVHSLEMGSLRRSEFLRCVPVALWGMACGESPSKSGAEGASGGSVSGGSSATSSGGLAASTGGTSEASGGSFQPGSTSGGAAPSTGGAATATGGAAPSTGGAATTMGGKNQGGTSGGITGGSQAAGAGGAPPALSCGADVGARASAEDFSNDGETTQFHAHLLVMSKGDIIRRVMNYVSSGEADHQHEFVFTDAQLVALLAGEGVVVQTDGPPLNAADGHTHTVRVHPCKA